MIKTERLILIPVNLASIRAEIESSAQLAVLLQADVPANWPPEILADARPWFRQQLEANPDLIGWFGWYGLLNNGEKTRPFLIGSAGFKGRPQEDGTVEIGYSVLPQFQQHGYAREMVIGLIGWAFSHPDVFRIIAETTPDNTPSIRVLLRAGFSQAGEGAESGHIRFELKRTEMARPTSQPRKQS